MVEHPSAQTAQQRRQRSLRPESPGEASCGSHGSPQAARRGRFSLLRWFGRSRRRGSSASSSAEEPRARLFRRRRASSSSSGSSSLGTYGSTATVRSFAFHSGREAAARALLTLGPREAAGAARVGPFGPGAVRLPRERAQPATCTLPSGFSQRQDLRTRYSLHPPAFASFDSIPAAGGGRRAERASERASEPPAARRLHVKGKRRAPEPPARPASAARRKRRPAPKPPVPAETVGAVGADAPQAGMDALQTIGNDTLLLRRGVLLPRTPTASFERAQVERVAAKPAAMMPRPWYKRNAAGEHSGSSGRRSGGDVLRGVPASPPNEATSSASASSTLSAFEGSLSRLGLFQRENKRKSGLSILTNISELDREAAAIVQEERLRHRASALLRDEASPVAPGSPSSGELVRDIVMESSPRGRSARSLIDKFNALGGAGLFGARQGSPKARPKRHSREFLRRGSPRRESASVFEEVVISGGRGVKDERKPPEPAVFAANLTAELDDVATGIARLRRDLDDRPSPAAKARPSEERGARERELANFDREFTRIFDEINRQLRPREPRKAESRPSSTVRISGVDDKTTIELKEMLKEMKHSLPKKPPVKSEEKPAKVSSAVQTCGNVRRIISPTPSPVKVLLEKPKEKENPAKVTEQLKDKDGSAEVKETLKDKEKLGKENEKLKGKESPVNEKGPLKDKESSGKEREPPENKENAYVNVKEVRIDLKTTKVAEPQPKTERQINGAVKFMDAASGSEKSDSNDEGGEKVEEAKKQCMNTLAVNRLLKKLEAAIASGHHQQAAGLAKELAQLKIQCSVVRQRPCRSVANLSLSMYIEDKQAHQGPIPLQLPANMSVAQLKAKIQLEFEIPANVQRWIIGKNLADNEESTLEELQAVEGSSIFLYIVAPQDLQDKETIKTADKREPDTAARQPGEEAKAEQKQEEVKVEQKQVEVKAEQRQVEVKAEQRQEVVVINVKNDEQIREIKAEIEPEPEVEAAAAVVAPEETKVPTPQPTEETLSKEEKLKRYEELMSLENCDVISNTEPIECPVCFMIAAPNEGVILRDCLHSFCRMCVENTVRYCEEAEVKCPYRDNEYTCESTLQEREIKALVPAEVYQQHLAKSIAQAENNAGSNAFHCKTPDCPGWCIYDDNVNNFLCPVCKVNNCLTCQAVHMGKNCRQYQEELKYSKENDHESKRTAAMLEEMVERGEALPCPTCAVVLMKKWGCDWLRCSMCKTEICWVTRGPRWGPGGKGDISGGCRCGENGVKCHPRCNYCH